jgi:prephenate dehydrogenase
MEDFKTITIIGVGLIGGSLGFAIKALPDSPRVIGFSRRAQTVQKALELGAIDEGASSLPEAVKDADLVFVATPISIIVDTVREIAQHIKAGSLISDVGSTKGKIVHAVETFLPKGVSFIGGHPMAGSEQQGVSFANAGLFRNSYYLLTPTKKTDAVTFQKLHSLLTRIGAQVMAIDPEKHDKIVSTISHLPHILSAALVNQADQQTKESKNLLLVAAGGFRDMTRIAASNPDMWRDICIDNSQAILEALEEFNANLAVFKQHIVSKDKDGLWNQFKEAQSVRMDLPKILHKEISDQWELSIPAAVTESI